MLAAIALWVASTVDAQATARDQRDRVPAYRGRRVAHDLRPRRPRGAPQRADQPARIDLVLVGQVGAARHPRRQAGLDPAKIRTGDPSPGPAAGHRRDDGARRRCARGGAPRTPCRIAGSAIDTRGSRKTVGKTRPRLHGAAENRVERVSTLLGLDQAPSIPAAAHPAGVRPSSITRTRAPSTAQRHAQARLQGPAPTTTRSASPVTGAARPSRSRPRRPGCPPSPRP